MNKNEIKHPNNCGGEVYGCDACRAEQADALFERRQKAKRIDGWFKEANSNPWIREAWDPNFTRESFHQEDSLEDAHEKMARGNWCLGAAFCVFDVEGHDYAFVNQVNGGDEWLTFKDGRVFESLTVGRIPLDEFRALLLKAG